MRTIRLTITALVLSVSSLTLGNAAQADGYSGKPAHSVHGQHQRHYYAPRYPSRPRVYGHDYYQYGHHGIDKKHRHYRHFGKAGDWRRRPHRFNDHHSEHSGYRSEHDSGEHRTGRDDDYRNHNDHNRHGRDHSRQMRTSYAESKRH